MIKKLPLLTAAKIALKHRLYVSGWFLGETIRKIVKDNPEWCKNYKMALYYYNKTPVGVCLRTNNKLLMVFVRKSYRNKGIGRKLVKCMKTTGCYGCPGISKSEGKIWYLNGVRIE